ncbi:MAG: serine hydrolase [Acidobacteriota bacterium]|nr:serine hydrolase [Acidobacteriota bacterium]
MCRESARVRASILVGIAVVSGAALPVAAADVETPSAAGLPIAAPEDVGMSSERLDRLGSAMQAYIDRNQVAGTVTLIARKGKVVHLEARGNRYSEGGEEMTADTIFRIASMTKPIASAALMILWEEGHFQLRDPISKWLPEFAEMRVAVVPDDDEYLGQPYKTVEALRPITVQHALTHTAGFPNSYRGPTRGLYTSSRAGRQPGGTVQDTLVDLAKMPLNFHPGEGWQYGPGVDVAGVLVEKISGQTLDAFLRERVFGPLRMKDTHFYLPQEKLDRFAALYKPGEDGAIELTEAPTAESRYVREPHTYFSGSGGLVSTAADYVRFQQMMLNGGELDGARILSRKTVELMTHNHIGDLGVWLRGPGYGFGIGYSVVTDVGQSAMPTSLGSYAWGGAFCTVFWVDPVEEVIGVLMTQVRPYTHLNIRQDLTTLTYQAIVD